MTARAVHTLNRGTLGTLPSFVINAAKRAARGLTEAVFRNMAISLATKATGRRLCKVPYLGTPKSEVDTLSPLSVLMEIKYGFICWHEGISCFCESGAERESHLDLLA